MKLSGTNFFGELIFVINRVPDKMIIYRFVFLLLLIFITANLYAQEFNTLVTDEETGEPMLIGRTTRDAFNDSSFSLWWNSTYNLYKVDSVTAEDLKDVIKDIDITIVMGTWCSDSQYEIPNLYKIFDYLVYPTERITLINVDRDKNGEGNELDRLKIELVPTIIFYKDEKELGRIVETPNDSLEKDILKILTGDKDADKNKKE